MKKGLLALTILLLFVGNVFSVGQSEEKVVLKFINHGDTGMEVLTQAKADFEAEYPNVTVNIENWPYNQARVKYRTMIEAKQYPDCGYLFLSLLAEFNAKGALAEFGSLVPDSFFNNFEKPYLEQVTIDNKIVAMPLYNSISLVVFRKDWAIDYGIDIESLKTTEGFLSTMPKVVDKSKNIYGFVTEGKKEKCIGRMWSNILWGFGGEFVSEDLKQCTFNSPEGVAAAEFLKDLMPFVQPNFLVDRGQEAAQYFYAENAFSIGQSVNIGLHIKNENLPIEFATMPYPRPAGNDPAAEAVMDVGIVFDTPNKEIAAKWLMWIMKDEYNPKISSSIGFLPMTKSGANYHYYKENSDIFGPAIELKEFAHFQPKLPEWPEIRSVMNNALHEICLGNMNAKEALDDAVKQGNEILSR